MQQQGEQTAVACVKLQIPLSVLQSREKGVGEKHAMV